ncbi:MAG TPA: transketolase [Acidimicrobiia bacterium]|nr:transketolase [Acidimicrobiia bacterium]
MDSMRDRFVAVVNEVMDADPSVALVLADIGVGRFADVGTRRRHPDRVINVGIREQAMVGVAAGLALAGMRPVVHTYAPFLVQRPFEQLKLDLGHQDLGAVLVSVGASHDSAASGRTHHAPGDVAALTTLPGWEIHVPGHPDEVETVLRHALAGSGRVYIRLTEDGNAEPHLPTEIGRLQPVRKGTRGRPTILAVGPVLDAVLDATAGADVTVAYAITPRPLDGTTLREVVTGTDVVVVEPYLTGTSAAAITAALHDRPIRLRSIGITETELRRYGTPEEHRRAHGLDATGIRRALRDLLAECPCRAV